MDNLEPQHAPLSNAYILISFLGIVIGISLWAITPEWGFLFLLLSILLFVATFVSAVRAPLPTDFDIELAVHEKYGTGRYPDTNIHAGLVKKGEKKYISKHKKHLVNWHVSTQEAEAATKRKPIAKKVFKKAAAKKKKPVQKLVKKTVKKVTKKRKR